MKGNLKEVVATCRKAVMMKVLDVRLHYKFLQALGLIAVLFFNTACMTESTGSSSTSNRAFISQDQNEPATEEPTTEEPQEEETQEVTRPDGQVYLQTDFCACLNNEPDIVGDCFSFCANRNTQTPTLFLNTLLGADIELNQELGTLRNWCEVEIGDGLTNPSCVLEAFDGFSTRELPVTFLGGTNSITADILTLDPGTTYVMTLVEKTSGAKSDSIQIRRKTGDDLVEVNGPLKVNSVAQYSCMQRNGATVDNYNFFDAAIRTHYYYTPTHIPFPIPPGNDFIFCHDIIAFPGFDNILYPRLELQSHVFRVWNENDVRFYDLDQNEQLDIHDEIRAMMIQRGVTPSGDIQLFNAFSWPNGPSFENSNNESNPKLGFIMTPFLNQQTGEAYCPDNSHYNGTETLFNVLREYIGDETEALYLAQREPVSFSQVDENGNTTVVQGPEDFVIVRESLLNQIWFYSDNGTPTAPDEYALENHTIMFYWPANTSSPYTRSSEQKIYILKHPSELGENEAPDIPRSTLPPNDKRFACAPKL